jgi:hypothetical protein
LAASAARDPRGDNHINVEANQFGRETKQNVVAPFRVTVVDDNIVAFNVAVVSKAVLPGTDELRQRRDREYSDAWRFPRPLPVGAERRK